MLAATSCRAKAAPPAVGGRTRLSLTRLGRVRGRVGARALTSPSGQVAGGEALVGSTSVAQVLPGTGGVDDQVPAVSLQSVKALQFRTERRTKLRERAGASSASLDRSERTETGNVFI